MIGSPEDRRIIANDNAREKKIFQPTEAVPFCIVAEPHDYYCDFSCYECIAYSTAEDGKFTIAEYHLDNYQHGLDITRELDKAQIYLSGAIKWDGCANLRFDEQDNVMLHFCGKASAAKVGTLLDRLYDIAAILIDSWHEGLAQ